MMVVTYKVKNPLLLQAAFSQCFITARKRKHQVLSPVRRRGLCTLQACLKLVWSNSVSRCVSAKLTGQNERQMVIRLVQMIDKFILLVNPAELFTTVAFSPHCAENHCEEWGDFKTTETEVWNALVQLTKDKSWTVVYILYWKIKYSGAKGNQIILCSKKGQHYRPHRLWLPPTPSAFNLLTFFSTHYSFLIFVSQSSFKILRMGYFMRYDMDANEGTSLKMTKKCRRDGSAARSSSCTGL